MMGLRVVTRRGHGMELRVTTCKRVIMFFLLDIRLQSVVWVLFRLSIFRSGGVLKGKRIFFFAISFHKRKTKKYEF